MVHGLGDVQVASGVEGAHERLAHQRGRCRPAVPCVPPLARTGNGGDDARLVGHGGCSCCGVCGHYIAKLRVHLIGNLQGGRDCLPPCPCHALPHAAVPRYAMPGPAIPCQAVPSTCLVLKSLPCRALPGRAMLGPAVPCLAAPRSHYSRGVKLSVSNRP